MSLPEVTDVQRFRLEPGDALVVHLANEHVSVQEAELVRERARAGLGLSQDTPVLVLAKGLSLDVVNSGALMSAGVPAACEGRAPAGAPVPGSPVNPAREVG